jgi:integrase
MTIEINRLDDVNLRQWMQAGLPVVKSDGGGLTFTLSKSGTASWILRYRLAGKAGEVTLGRYPDLTLKAARVQASQLRVKIQQGIDVASEKQARLAEHREAQTIKDLAEEWLDHAIRPKLKHPVVVERVFRRDIFPALGRTNVREVTTEQLTRLLAKISASGRPTIANDALRYLKRMFTYGEALGLVERNPAEKLTTAMAGGKESPRRRWLDEGEVRKLFVAIREAGLHFTRDNLLAVRLLMTLGVRKMELFGATWDEMDMEAGEWRIPSARTKTVTARTLPLPPQVVEWLEEVKARAGGSRYLFPARRASKRFGHVSPDTLWRALHSLPHGLEPFSVHDLRRTSRSLMANAGIPFDVAEKILGHELPAIASIYDRGDAAQQKFAALTKMAALVVELEQGLGRTNNIIPLRKTA